MWRGLLPFLVLPPYRFSQETFRWWVSAQVSVALAPSEEKYTARQVGPAALTELPCTRAYMAGRVGEYNCPRQQRIQNRSASHSITPLLLGCSSGTGDHHCRRRLLAPARSREQAMKLKINKACDLGSISVLPPRWNPHSPIPHPLAAAAPVVLTHAIRFVLCFWWFQ